MLRLLLSLALNKSDVPVRELTLEQYTLAYPKIINTILELATDTENVRGRERETERERERERERQRQREISFAKNKEYKKAKCFMWMF